MDRGPTRTVIFHREDCFYMLDLPISDDIAEHAHVNPGTLRVETWDGELLWEPGATQ